MYQYHIVAEHNLIVLKLSGVVHWEDIGRYFGELVENSDYHRELKGVCDLRGADLQFSPEESKQLARISREQQLTTGRWAFITDTPSGTALAIIYGREIGDFHTSKFFTTIAAASEFLSIDLTPYLEPDN
ncbi:MAG: hypothetical protein ABFS08_03195 [Pseudomonadota bacterium]